MLKIGYYSVINQINSFTFLEKEGMGDIREKCICNHYERIFSIPEISEAHSLVSDYVHQVNSICLSEKVFNLINGNCCKNYLISCIN